MKRYIILTITIVASICVISAINSKNSDAKTIQPKTNIEAEQTVMPMTLKDNYQLHLKDANFTLSESQYI